MGEFVNKTMGKAKKTIGKATGNKRLQTRGIVQEYTGKAEGVVNKTMGRTRNASARVRKMTKRPTGQRSNTPNKAYGKRAI